MKFFAIFATILAVGTAFPSSWTLQDLSAALLDPNTDPALIPYLESALNDLYAAIHAGQDVDSILVPIPGIIPVPAEPVLKPEPAAPLPVSSPLVQVIVNVNNKLQQIHEVAVPESPAIVPSPVDVADPAPIEVNPVPAPIEIIPAPAPIEISPAPAPALPEFNPIDVIAINPEPIGILEVNPAGDLGPIV